MKKLFLMACMWLLIAKGQAQPANEVNCFRFFQDDFVGNSRVNAYLLMLLNHYDNPKFLVNIMDENDPRVKELHSDEKKFLVAFGNRVNHFFYDPSKAITPIINTNIKSNIITAPITTNLTPIAANRPPYITAVNYNGGNGYDPECTIISTNEYIIIIFRGTDRVASNLDIPLVGDLVNNFIYSASEWITTDANFLQETALEGIPGKVHHGFNASLNYIRTRIEDTLINRLGAANKKIWITGHSLGSAHAQLFGTYLKKKYPNLDIRGVYAYAAPHVGDATFVEQMNRLLPGAHLQRFDFMDDPITQLPRDFMGYQKAGIRNLYTKEQGANYNYNTAETKPPFGLFYFCMHHTNWYARASFFELIDHQPDLQGKIPNTPPRPTEFCSSLDLQRATGSGNLLTAGGTDLPEGTYYISCVRGGKYIDAPTETADQNGTRVQLYDLGNSLKNNQWVVKKVPNAIIESYTIQAVFQGKYIDADFSNTGNDGCKVQLWERGFGLRTNQEWKIVRLDNGAYQILNVMSSKALDAVNNCTGQNGCKLQLYSRSTSDQSQQWYFIRVD